MLPEETSKFFNVLATGEDLTFQVFGEKGGEKKAKYPAQYFHGAPDTLALQLHKFNDGGLGVYFMVNAGDGKGRSAENVIAIRALFIDLDGAPLEPALEYDPAMVVESSPGRYHCYWLSDGIELEDFTPIQKALAKKFNADPSCTDLPRVLRVPGFKNRKNGIDFTVRIHHISETSTAITSKEDALQRFGITLEQAPVRKTSTGGQRPGKFGEVEQAMLTLGSDYWDDYQRWIEIGMAIHSEFPGEDGFYLWDEWSRQSSKYKSGECRKKWNSFGSGGITINSLFYEAYQNGFAPVVEDAPAGPVKSKQPPIAKLPKSDALSELAMEAPGLVGDITRWMTSVAFKPQPVLCLASALATVGAIKGHRVRTETNLRTNLLVAAVAKSGRGKNWPMEAAENILKGARQEGLLAGEPSSSAAIMKCLFDNRGRALILWDEFGMELEQITSRGAAGYQASIISTMTKIFSKAGSLAIGKQYGNGDGKRPREDVNQPCLCVFGASTPEAFYESLQSKHATQGFLPRWLVLEASDARVRKNRGKRNEEPPGEIVRRVYEIANMPVNANPEGTADLEIRPKVIPYTDAARATMWTADDYFEDLAESAERGRGLDAVWCRAAEHAAKVALTVTDGDEIGEKEVIFSLEVIKLCLESLTRAIMDRVSDNSTEQLSKRILRIVKENGQLTGNELSRKTQFVSAKQRKEIITDLLQNGLLQQVQADSHGSRGPVALVYRCES